MSNWLISSVFPQLDRSRLNRAKTKLVGRKFINSLSLIPREFKGKGFFAGTVTRQNRPVRATIQLIHSETGTIARTTTSEVDGTFMFQNIDENSEYHIVAIDPSGEWEHKVSSRRYPRTSL